MKHSSIQWTDHTFNPWIGCSKASPGCQHCYAQTLMETRYKRAEWSPQGLRVRTKDWRGPIKWDTEASTLITRFRVFTASLADIFEDRDDLVPWRDDLHDLIRSTPNLDWFVLTKRPEVAACYYEQNPIPANVWLGTSVENKAMAAKRIPVLTSIKAGIRFLSIEPLLEDLGELPLKGIHWVIVGGESGPGCRPMGKPWVQSIRDQCLRASVPFFFKQWGGSRPKSNGNELDGIIHEEFPVCR